MSTTTIIRSAGSTTLQKFGPETAAAIALTSGYKDAAETAKTAAEAAQTASETAQGIAEAAALTAPQVYATKAAGVAAVGEGETFWSDEDGGVKLYRDVSGVATLLDEVIVAATLAGTGGAALVGFLQSGTGAVGRTLEDEARDRFSVKQFGATGDGTTDDSAAIAVADAAAAAAGYGLYYPPGVYAAASLSITAPFAMAEGAKFLYNGAATGTLLTITASDKSFGHIHLDGGTEDVTLLDTNSGSGNTFSDIVLENVTASSTSGTSIFGLVVGDDHNIGQVSVRNFANTGQSNESFPQGVIFQGDESHVATINGTECATLVVSGSTSETNTVGTIIAGDGVTDNGIYFLGGILSVGSLHYYGNNEPFVVKGGAGDKLYIGYCKNNAGASVGTGGIAGIEDGGDLSVDHYEVGPNVASIFRTRSSQTASGNVRFGLITGDFTGVTLWSISTGTIENLTIDNMDITYRYDAAVSGPTSSWADFSACKAFNFGRLRIRIIDVNDALTSSASRFTMRAPTTNLANDSFVGGIITTIEKGSDGTDSPALMRGVSFFGSTLTHVENAYVERSGPFIREVAQDQHFSGIVFDSTSAPSAGTYRAGQIVYVNAPAAGDPIGHIYTGSAWEPFGIAGLEQAAAVADLNQTISDPPTQAEVQAISDKVDELLASERTAGQRAT